MLEFNVNGQILERVDETVIYGDTKGQITAKFNFNEWWSYPVIVASFTKDGKTSLRVLEKGECEVPSESVSGEGNLLIALYSSDGGKLKTTNAVKILINESGYTGEPSPPDEGVWEKIVDLLGGLRGGQKGQYLQKHSDDNYDFEFVDLPTEGTENLYMINDLSNLSEFYTCNSSVEETGDNIFPYELIVWGDIKLGDWDYQTGEFDSYFNTDFGLKREKSGDYFVPSINNGDVDIVIASTGSGYGANTVKNFFDSAFSGGLYDYHNISSDIKFAPYDCSIAFEHKFKFEFDPEDGWTDELITTLLEGKTQNGMGEKLTQIGVRISIPNRKDIEVV